MQTMSFDNNQYEMEMMFVTVRTSLLTTIISNRSTKLQTKLEQNQQLQKPSTIRCNRIKVAEQKQKSNNHIEWRFDDDEHDENSDSITTFIQQNDVKNIWKRYRKLQSQIQYKILSARIHQ